MKHFKPRKYLAISVIMALLLSMMVFNGSLASDYLVAEETILSSFTGNITLDVNPSIELIIENGTVTQALAYNDDGKNLLPDSDLVGLTAEEAVKAMTRVLAEGGYLTSSDITPYLVITVSGSGAPEEDTANDLLIAAKQVAEELGIEIEVKSAFVADDVAAQAAAAGLSTGKYLLMQYIAKAEAITLEETIAKYGAVSIGELMNQFEDAADVFNVDGLLLTEEQRAALESAFALQKESIKAAEKAFHDAFKSLKSTYREMAHSITKTKKEVDAQTLTDSLNQLKEQFLAEYQTVRQALDGTVSAARAAFLDAVAIAGIPGEFSAQYYSWHMNKESNSEGELNAFLKEFTYKAKGKDKGKGKDNVKVVEDEVLLAENKDIALKEVALNVQNEVPIENQGVNQGKGQDQNKDQGKGKAKGKDKENVKEVKEEVLLAENQDIAPKEVALNVQNEVLIENQGVNQGKGQDQNKDQGKGKDEDKGKNKDENKGQGESGEKSNNGKSDKGKK